jgi:diguanylate cyclase (GGDEF)-like protein/PAS domain S-box-containing protein
MYGYTADEVVGKATPRILKSGEMAAEGYRLYWQTLLNKEAVKGELINRTKDGLCITVEGSANAVLDEQGAIVGFLGIQRDITDRKQMEANLLELSIHDVLTGLYNRRFFEEEMARLERGRQFPVSMIMADLNYLKQTNDRDGHSAGDLLLQRAAQVITSTFRAEDIIARIGGDEVAILLPGIDTAAAEQYVRRIRLAIDEHNAAQSGTPLSIAFGVSTAEQGDALADTLREADARMYVDKGSR